MSRALVVLAVVAFVIADPAFARRRPSPPLMQSFTVRDEEPRASHRFVSVDRGPRSYGGRVHGSARQNGQQAFGLGAELGIAARASDSAGSISSTQLFLGGRLVARIPVSSSLYLKPSAGFFFNSGGTGAVGLNQQVIEIGLTGQWAFAKGRRSRWLLGLANRLDLQWISISSFGASGSSPMFLRYRVGPAIGGLFGVGKDVSLAIDAETTFSLGPFRPHFGLTGGFVYYW